MISIYLGFWYDNVEMDVDTMERLQKIIAAAGIASRRKAEEMITQGRVKVNGEIITELGFKASKKDDITVDGKDVIKESLVYYVLYKPKKTLCTVKDERERQTVTSLIDCPERIYPVGRLDYDTSGLLILTNDGEFANEIIHPRFHLPKTYEVTIDNILKTEQIKELEKGVILDDGIKTLPAKVWVTNKDFGKQTTNFDLTILEGRNRQIKRMMEGYGYTVTRLHRKQLGFLTIKDLTPGQYRLLKPFEVKQLKKMAQEGKS